MAFFSSVGPFLLGERTAQEVQRELGPSPSGTDNLEFYRVLASRNFHKILRDIYPSVHALVVRQGRARWTQMVDDYARCHRCAHWNPNRFGEAFSDYLSAREQDGPQGPLWAEMADFTWAAHLAATAPDDAAAQERVFVRQYRFPVAAYIERLTEDPQAPEPTSQASLVMIYRSLIHGHNRVLRPTVEMLAAWARQVGTPLPGVLADLPSSAIDRGRDALIAAGVIPGLSHEYKEQYDESEMDRDDDSCGSDRLCGADGEGRRRCLVNQ